MMLTVIAIASGTILLVLLLSLAVVKFIARARPSSRSQNGTAGASRTPQQDQADDARRLPYRYVDDLIFISGSGVWTALRQSDYGDEYATYDELEAQSLSTPQLLGQMISAIDESTESLECHEVVRYRPVTADGWITGMRNAMWNPTRRFLTLIERVGGHLRKASPRREHFLLIRLGDFTAPAAADPLAYFANDLIGVHDEQFTHTDLEPFWDKARRFQEIGVNFGGMPTSRQDLLWLIRKTLSGSLPVDDEPITDTRPWKAGEFEFAAQMSGRNTPTHIEIDGLDADTGQPRTSYVATLVMTNRPQRMMFNPNSAWAKKLGELPHPPEISWRYRLEHPQVFKRKFKALHADIQDEADSRTKAGAFNDLKFDQRYELAEELKQEMELGDPPIPMYGRLRFVVSAPSRKELTESINRVKRTLDGVGIKVDRARNAQWRLFEEQLPGDPPSVKLGALTSNTTRGLRLFERQTDAFMAGVGLLNSHNEVGDQTEILRGRELGWIGPGIGYTQASGAPVHFDPHVQVNRNRGAGVAVLGASGGGKSTLSLMLFFWMSEAGTQCVALDPKNDFERFLYYLAFGAQVTEPNFWHEARNGTLGTTDSAYQPINRDFWDNTEIIDLSQGRVGLLDPWRISADYDAAEQLAHSITEMLFPDSQQHRLITRALRAMRKDWLQACESGQPFTPCYGKIVDYLRPEVEQLATDEQSHTVRESKAVHEEVIDKLERATRSRYVRLLIGDGSASTNSWNNLSARRTVITMHGFRAPTNADPSDWSEDERNAAAALYTVLHRVYGMFNSDEQPNPVTGRPGTPPRALFVDEGYMLARTPQGRELLLRGLRQGRSLNLVIVFVGQQPRDVAGIEAESAAAGEADVNQFGTVFMFRQRSLGEARAGLELLRATSGEADNQGRVSAQLAQKLLEPKSGGALETGMCVMRDVDNRVATVIVDTIFEELQTASQTNARIRSDEQAHELVADVEDWTIDEQTLLDVRTGIFDVAPGDMFDDDIATPETPAVEHAADDTSSRAGTAPATAGDRTQSVPMRPAPTTPDSGDHVDAPKPNPAPPERQNTDPTPGYPSAPNPPAAPGAPVPPPGYRPAPLPNPTNTGGRA